LYQHGTAADTFPAVGLLAGRRLAQFDWKIATETLMVRLDFWNNPIVVSAFRSKGRKQFPLATYILVLVGIGAVLEYFSRVADRPWMTPWTQIHLVVVVAVTAGASFLFAMVATQSSIASEVSNKTLDFQRIAGMSPAQVVVGKIFGEPALAYLMIPASFPVALFGVLRSETLTIGSLLVAYLGLATFAVLGGATGLLHPLEQNTNKPGGGGAAAGWAILFMIGAPYLIGSGFLIRTSPTAAFALGTFTPAPVIAGLYQGDVWMYSLHLFNWSMPYAVYSPIAQLCLAFLLFSIMARRLKNPVETPLPKPLAYLVLAIANLLLVGYLIGEDPLKRFGGVGYNLATLSIANTVVTLLLVFCVTPNREGVDSWIWGLRGVKHDWRDWLFGDRSPNLAAVVVMGAINVAGACLLLAVSGGIPEGLADSNHLGSRQAPFSNWVGAAVALVLVFSFGFTLQAMSLALKRMTAFIILGTFYLLFGMILAGFGRTLQWSLAVSLSPFAQFIAWMDPREFQEVGIFPQPYFIAFTLITAVGMMVTLRYLWGFRRIVAAKLQGMGVATPELLESNATTKPT
jgi:hypothetical protein